MGGFPVLTPRLPIREQLDRALERAIRNARCRGIAVARRDGLPIAHRLERPEEARLASAMAAAVLGAVGSVAAELRQGDVNHVVIDCTLGKVIALQAGPEAALIAWLGAQSNVGLALLGLRRAADEVAAILREM